MEMRPFWKVLSKVSLLGLFGGSLGLCIPQFSRLLFDRVLPERDWHLLVVAILGACVVSTAQSIINYSKSLFGNGANAELSMYFLQRFARHLQRLPISFWEQHAPGEVFARTADLQRSVGFVTGAFQTILTRGFYVLIVPPILFYTHWQLAILALLTVPATLAISLVKGRQIRKLAKVNIEASSAASAVQFDLLAAHRLIKTAAAETVADRMLAVASESVKNSQIAVSNASSKLTLTNAVVTAIATAVYSYYAWTQILTNRLTIGEFVAFSAYLGFLRGPLGEIAGLASSLQTVSVSMSRYFSLGDQIREVPLPEELPAPVVMSTSPWFLELRKVRVVFPNGRLLLNDVSMSLRAGEMGAIVGSTGCGKTTLLQLLVRLQRPTCGEILVNGIPIDQTDIVYLRQHVGVSWQDRSFVRGTIRDNLLLGNAGCTDYSLWRALEKACLADEIATLPDGLNTYLGDGGVSFSAGEHQRLGIARVLARPRPLLLFDEATASLDPATEERVVQNLVSLRGKATILFVTHRERPARAADRVFFVNNKTLSLD